MRSAAASLEIESAGASSIAQILFVLFLILFLVSLVVGLGRRGGPAVKL